jgi:hypothetical protein
MPWRIARAITLCIVVGCGVNDYKSDMSFIVATVTLRIQRLLLLLRARR